MHSFADHELMLRELFPLDVGGEPLYIVAAEDLGQEYMNPLATAYCSPCLSVLCESRLREMRRWVDDGVIIVIVDAQRWRYRFDWFRQMGILIHELAHACDWASIRRKVRDHTQTIQEAPGPRELIVDQYYAKPPLWDLHEHRFIRSALHLRQRAALAGCDVSLDLCTIAGDEYGLSPAQLYAEHLLEEIHDRTGERVADILDTPAPAGFDALWKADTQAYFERLIRASCEKRFAAGASPAEVLAALKTGDLV